MRSVHLSVNYFVWQGVEYRLKKQIEDFTRLKIVNNIKRPIEAVVEITVFNHLYRIVFPNPTSP